MDNKKNAKKNNNTKKAKNVANTNYDRWADGGGAVKLIKKPTK